MRLESFDADLPRMLVVLVVLGLVASSPARRSVDSVSDDRSASDSLEEASLNEMIQEVDELMKDTQSKLSNAVKEMEAEEMSADRVALKDLPPNYHNTSIRKTIVGNDTIITKQEIVKKTDNQTGSAFVSETIISTLSGGDRRHECMVDEDCGVGGYCHLADYNYKCLPCKDEDTALCTRDGECCSDQLCVWGQCKKFTKGESGTVCESQQDCAPGLCCAVHASLLFPVCTPLPVKGEECQTSNPLLDLLTWSLEPEAPSNYCPCASGLVCQPQSYSLASVCEEPSEQKTDHPAERSVLTAAPQEDVFYENSDVLPTGLGVDRLEDEKDVEFISEPHFVDYI